VILPGSRRRVGSGGRPDAGRQGGHPGHPLPCATSRPPVGGIHAGAAGWRAGCRAPLLAVPAPVAPGRAALGTPAWPVCLLHRGGGFPHLAQPARRARQAASLAPFSRVAGAVVSRALGARIGDPGRVVTGRDENVDRGPLRVHARARGVAAGAVSRVARGAGRGSGSSGGHGIGLRYGNGCSSWSGRDLAACEAPKEQPSRKLSGTSTALARPLWKAGARVQGGRASHRRCKRPVAG
jgi:hypothetical protein